MAAIVGKLKDSYQWRSGSQFKVDPGVVGARLEQLAELGGGHITTEMIANEANFPASPLYDLFEHNMEDAAFQWHLQQARKIANSLVIVTVIPAERAEKEYKQVIDKSMIIDIEVEQDDDDMVRIEAPAYPSIYVGGQRYYTPLQVVLHDHSMTEQYKARILKELHSIARKAKNFKVFEDVVNAIMALPEPEQETIQFNDVPISTVEIDKDEAR